MRTHVHARTPVYARRNLIGIGVNCTPPQYVSQLLGIAAEEIRDMAAAGVTATDSRPMPVLFCYPNSGEEWDAVEKVTVRGCMRAWMDGCAYIRMFVFTDM